jgi:hypothetical protein
LTEIHFSLSIGVKLEISKLFNLKMKTRTNVDEKNAKGLNDAADTWWDPNG